MARLSSISVARDMIQVMVGSIVLIGVAIPIILDSIASSGATGTTATVMGIVPVFLGLILIVIISKELRHRIEQ